MIPLDEARKKEIEYAVAEGSAKAQEIVPQPSTDVNVDVDSLW